MSIMMFCLSYWSRALIYYSLILRIPSLASQSLKCRGFLIEVTVVRILRWPKLAPCEPCTIRALICASTDVMVKWVSSSKIKSYTLEASALPINSYCCCCLPFPLFLQDIKRHGDNAWHIWSTWYDSSLSFLDMKNLILPPFPSNPSQILFSTSSPCLLGEG